MGNILHLGQGGIFSSTDDEIGNTAIGFGHKQPTNMEKSKLVHWLIQ
jgi:hypothetical protein